MAKDKEAKKEKKTKKIKSSELAAALGDATNTSTDIILTSTPTKDKSRGSIEPDEEDFYESRLAAQAPFAKPLANKKLNKKVLKTIKKGIYTPPGSLILMIASQAKELRRGVKEVVKALRKGEKGYSLSIE